MLAPGYREQILRIFQPNEDGAWPQAGLVADADGNLFGTTWSGGKVEGSVFELSPSAGSWSETILLAGSADLGSFTGGVILDSAGNLYGPSHGSVIFELSPPAPAQ